MRDEGKAVDHGAVTRADIIESVLSPASDVMSVFVGGKIKAYRWNTLFMLEGEISLSPLHITEDRPRV